MKSHLPLALLILSLASPLSAQHAKRDSSLSTTLKAASDTIMRDRRRAPATERARLRVLAVSDSLKRSKPDTVHFVTTDTIIRVKVETVYVTKPDTVKPPLPPGIVILPGQSIQAFVDANPGLTTFILKAGRHVRQDVRPKAGNTFRGEGPSTILDGENVAVRAFRGHNGGTWVNNVTLKNFTITKYAPPAQSGAVWGGDDNSQSTDSWVLDSMDINYNKNLGVRVGHRMKVLRSRINYNGTINIGGAGKGILVDSSTFNFGNQGCPNNPGFESGGSKFVVTDSLIVRNSVFSENCGVGLWLDINNRRYILENNLVERNIREGIAVEVGYGGKIRNNRVNENGHGTDPFRGQNWLWDAGIGIHASDSVEVYGNILRENFNGIAIVQQKRDNTTESYAPPPPGFLVRDVWVHDNTIIQKNPQAAGFENSVGGAVQDYTYSPDVFNRNNKWDRNTYCVAGRARPFTWMGGWRTLAEWRSYGQDLNSTVDGPSCGTTGGGTTDGPAELPRLVPSVVAPSCGTTVAVTAGADLQQAINLIQPGGCLLLAAGATFVGNYILPAKGSTSWVSIITQAALPAVGTRMTPSTATSLNLAKILSPNYSAAITIAQGAGYYRLRGLEIATTPAAQSSGMNMLVDVRNNASTFSTSSAPKFIQIEQSWIHGTSTLDLRRCIWLDSYMSSVIDSWVEDCHSNNTDSQAGLSISGARGILWQNNYLEGGHEILMWGGGDPPDSTLQPSDVTVRRNHITRPISWRGVWQIKNLIEGKNVRRLLVEGNVIENTWQDAQAGFCFVLKGENQNGTAPWSTSADITIRLNKINRCASGFNLSGRGTAGPTSFPSARFSIHDNYVDSTGKYGGDGIAIQSLNDIDREEYRKNTFTNGLQGFYSNNAISMDGSPATLAVWDGNILGHGAYGVKGSGTADGTGTLNTYAPGATFTRNAIVGGGGCTQYPSGNTCPSVAPASTSTTGADITLLNQLTSSVVISDPLNRTRTIARQGQLKFKYRPSPAICRTAARRPLENLKCDVRLLK